MNIIGISVPKIVLLIGIWAYPSDVSTKLSLTGICCAKFVYDFDCAKPGHSGILYRLVKKIPGHAETLIVELMRLILVCFFLLIAYNGHSWVAFAMGLISSGVILYECVHEIMYLYEVAKIRR